MQTFYKKALAALVLLLSVQGLLAGILVYESALALPLLPAGGKASWRYGTFVDAGHGGKSTIRLRDAGKERLAFDFRLDGTIRNPFVDAELVMEDERARPSFIDLSRYTSVSFVARCSTAHAMIFGIATFDQRFSKAGDFPTYPSPQTYFACDEKGVPVSLDITRLWIPAWWFDAFRLEPPQQGYHLRQVGKILFGTTLQSPIGTDAHVEISQLVLHGRDFGCLYAAAAVVLGGWAAYGAWFVRAHSRALKASLEGRRNKDLPLLAYRQLTLEPSKDREKAAVLRFIASHFADQGLDLEQVAAGAGVNRTKVNEVLRTELGMTFTGYVNKLRLSEAARILAGGGGQTVAQVAEAVGYAHVSYFNKLFKEEYGCTPKAFRATGVAPEP